MSRQFRYRVTAFVLGGLFLGAPLLMNGTASADQFDPGSKQVTFDGGGMLGLSCESRPDTESMTVPADSTVRMVNRTGHNAKLQLSGTTKGTLADGAVTEVVFRRGTTSVMLTPTCAFGNDTSPVMVTASPSAAAVMPDPIPAPTSGNSTPSRTAEPGDTDDPSHSAGGSALPDALAPTNRPHRPHRTRSATKPPKIHQPSTSHTAAAAPAATRAAQTMPHDDAAARLKSKAKALSGTPGAAAAVPRAFAGMPLGDARTLVDGVPQVDLTPMTSDATPAGSVDPVETVAAQPAAEPVAAMTPMRTGARIGLLGVIAAVCAVGVTTAAIRAIVSQRANRANMA